MLQRKKHKQFICQVWQHVAEISSIRSPNSPPKTGIEEDFVFLSDLLIRMEQLAALEDVQQRFLSFGGEKELQYLWYGFNHLKQYNTPLGPVQLKEEDVRIYIYFVQSRYMELVRLLIDLLV